MNAEIKTTVKPFIPREPDWKQLYYSLALQVTAAFHQFEATDIIAENAYTPAEKAKSITRLAYGSIMKTEQRIDAGNSIVAVAQSDLPEGFSSWREFREKNEALLAEEKLKAAQGK